MSARLIYADSESSPDMLYACGIFVPDSFLWMDLDGKSVVVVSALEYARVKKFLAKKAEVISFSELKERYDLKTLSPADQIAALAKKHFKRRSFKVPYNFPAGLMDELAKKHKIKLQPVKGYFFPEREFKTAKEIRHLSDGVKLAEAGMYVAFDILKKAKIRGTKLIWNKKELTADILRGEIDAHISRLGGLPAHTIVAPGKEGADPHNVGHGLIRPHQPIIIDIFPRVMNTGYFGDLTRTVVKGTANDITWKAFNAVKDARDSAIAQLKDGVLSKTIHQGVVSCLESHGFETDSKVAKPYGFFHSTGHGLGLEIHEQPRLSNVNVRMRKGHVVTVEPGLYYPKWGGLRLEDVLVVTKHGCRNLTTVDTFLEIK
ncbi:MAG: aminopeptidase P family protein [Lentisphaeria bacterium]|nr:M24 family metallopeptidase [Lentisphaeria bacterium]NQZ67150.1 aminopeptidase P family protein [Lentisphaeria bacterium]